MNFPLTIPFPLSLYKKLSIPWKKDQCLVDFHQALKKGQSFIQKMSHHYYLFLLLVSVSILLVHQSGATVVPFIKSLKMTLQCSCKTPQSRLIYIGIILSNKKIKNKRQKINQMLLYTEDLEEYAEPNVIYSPKAVVVQRCDRLMGYCHQMGQVCASAESEEEEVTFTVQKTNIPGKPLITIPLKNHSRCECITSNVHRAR